MFATSLELSPKSNAQSKEKEIHPEIAGIYDTLAAHPRTAPPISCNFTKQVIDHWAKNPNRLAILSLDQDTNSSSLISYADLVSSSHQIARFFNNKGFKKGEPVALMLGQHPAWWQSVVGLIRAGIPIVPFSRLLTAKDLIYRFNDLKIKGIIASPELESRINGIRGECPSLEMTVTLGTGNKDWHAFSDILKVPTLPFESNTSTQDDCLYLYTSGTTGNSKPVQHNHDYPFFHWPTGNRWMQATPEDLVYNASDTGWGFSFWTTAAAWTMGSKLLITPTNKKYDAHVMLKTLENYPVTIFCAAPTVLRLLAAQPNFDRFRFPTLKRIVTVGESLDETVLQKFASRGIQVHVGFGQAETPLLIARVDNQSHQPGTMGKPVSPYHVVILDDNFKPLPPGNMGQIALDLVEGSAPGLMRQYKNAPDRTRSAFSPDGRYYLTGDWALHTQNGFVYEGRRDDLIKASGYRIGPAEVEEAGMKHPAIAKIAVVGVRTDLNSAAITVKAFILLKPDYTATPKLAQEIQNLIKNETAPNKYPRLIEFMSPEVWQQFETTRGKIRRNGLRELELARLKDKKPGIANAEPLLFSKAKAQCTQGMETPPYGTRALPKL